MVKHISIGGVVAAGCDPNMEYLITVSHSGRGVFSLDSFERVARDYSVIYPDDGTIEGIGPLDGVSVPVTEIDYDSGKLEFQSADSALSFVYESGTFSISRKRA